MSPGLNEVSVEMITAEGSMGVQWLERELKCVWKLIKIPKNWGLSDTRKITESFLVTTETITIICQVARIFEKVILNRVKGVTEAGLSQEQHGFRKGEVQQI